MKVSCANANCGNRIHAHDVAIIINDEHGLRAYGRCCWALRGAS